MSFFGLGKGSKLENLKRSEQHFVARFDVNATETIFDRYYKVIDLRMPNEGERLPSNSFKAEDLLKLIPRSDWRKQPFWSELLQANEKKQLELLADLVDMVQVMTELLVDLEFSKLMSSSNLTADLLDRAKITILERYWDVVYGRTTYASLIMPIAPNIKAGTTILPGWFRKRGRSDIFNMLKEYASHIT